MTLNGGTGATGWSWSGPNGYSSTSQSPILTITGTVQEGVYTVTATNGCGSASARTSLVTVNTTPTSVTATASLSSICSGNSLTLTGGGEGTTSWAWSGPNSYASTTQSPTLSITGTAQGGVYSVTATNSCGSVSANTNLVAVNNGTPSSLTASAIPNPVCTGNSLTLTESGGTEATGWSWSGPNSYSSTSQSPILTITSTVQEGIYTVTATNSCGSASANTSSVTVKTSPTSAIATASTNPICEGSSLTLTESDNEGTSWNWSGPNGYSATLQSPTLSITGTAEEGVYTVTATNFCGSTSANTSPVNVKEPPTTVTATASPNPICEGNSLTLTESDNGGTGWRWTGPNSYNSTSQSPTLSITDISQGGVYTVTATNSCGSATANTNSVTINYTSSPGEITSNSPQCEGTAVTFTEGSCPIGCNCYWETISNGTSSGQPGSTPLTTLTAAGTYTEYINAQNTITGCWSGTVSATGTIYSIPATPTINLNGNILHSDATTGNQWYDQAGIISGETGQDYTPTTSGNYHDIVTIDGCSSNTSNVIYVDVTGINDLSNHISFYLYPNPANSLLVVSYSLLEKNNLNISIYDVMEARLELLWMR